MYQVGINKGIILRCTAYQISRLINTFYDFVLNKHNGDDSPKGMWEWYIRQFDHWGSTAGDGFVNTYFVVLLMLHVSHSACMYMMCRSFFPHLLLNVLLRCRTPCGLRSMWVGCKLALAVIVSSWVTLHTVTSSLTFISGVYFTSLVIAIHVVTFQKLTGPALP